LEQHAVWLLGLIAQEHDLTLQDIQMLLLQEKALCVGLGSVWRFHDRHGINGLSGSVNSIKQII
jgi:hypothetical protein